MNSFDGLCALITGSASGLGAATAVALAHRGARVIINYRASAGGADETADLCRAANAEVKLVQADVAIDEDCHRLVAAAADWGRLDILVNSATLALARALAPLIRVNAVCPGYMDTPWWTRGIGQGAADNLRELVKSAVPLRVASRPEDIAEVVMFLAGPASRHMTGAIVPADAGVLLLVPVSATDAHR